MSTRTNERQFYSILIRVVFFVVTAASLIALFGEKYWVAELFTHFRLYYLLLHALLALIFLHTGRRILLALTLLFAMPNMWIVGPYLVPVIGGERAAAGVDTGIEIVALNVNYHNNRIERTREYLRLCDPDIIIIAEFTPEWRDGLKFLRDTHPHGVESPRSNPWGLAVYSRLPLVESRLIDLAETDTAHAQFVVAAGTSTLEVFAIHLLPPVTSRLAHDRNLQLADLARRVAASKHHRVVIGDMNLSPFSPYFDGFLRRTGLRDARRVDGFHVTWPASALPVWLPIDHALADPEANIVRVRAGPDVGSDHFPLEILVAGSAREPIGRDRNAFQ